MSTAAGGPPASPTSCPGPQQEAASNENQSMGLSDAADTLESVGDMQVREEQECIPMIEDDARVEVAEQTSTSAQRTRTNSDSVNTVSADKSFLVT